MGLNSLQWFTGPKPLIEISDRRIKEVRLAWWEKENKFLFFCYYCHVMFEKCRILFADWTHSTVGLDYLKYGENSSEKT